METKKKSKLGPARYEGNILAAKMDIVV